jgi:hypothetical protein
MGHDLAQRRLPWSLRAPAPRKQRIATVAAHRALIGAQLGGEAVVTKAARSRITLIAASGRVGC